MEGAPNVREQGCSCKTGMFSRFRGTNRLNFLFAAGSLAGLVGSSAFAHPPEPKAPPGSFHFDVPADPTKEQGRAVAADGGYATTLFDYVKRAMPFSAPGSLSDEEVYSVVAHSIRG